MPFYLRTGKRLGRRVTEVAIVFKRAPHLPFSASATEDLTQNALVIRIQPDEGMTMRFGSKVPGTAMEIRDVNMDFAYGGSFTESSPEAYERLILDVLLGDPPLFPRHEEVELSWKILDPILEHWAKQDAAGKGKPDTYDVRRPGAPDQSTPDDATMLRPRRADAPGGDPEMIELTDTNSAAIAAEFVRARTKAGSPAMGMVMTLVIVVDEDVADEAMAAAREASHEHPARVLGVILGDARGAAAGQRPGRRRRRLDRRDRADPAQGRGRQAPRVRRAAAAAAGLPGRDLVADRPARRHRRRPARARSRSAGSPTPPAPRAARARRSTRSARRTPRATPTWPGPGSRRGARCWPPRSTSTTSR